MNLKRAITSMFGHDASYRSSITAVDNLSLDLPAGSRIGLIGENGAGKTTLLRVLAGSLPPAKGKVRIKGSIQSFIGSPLHGLDIEMSGYENIEYVSLINNHRVKKGTAIFDDIAEFTGLKERLSDPVFTYSAGMRARLRFSILTAFTPDILLLDEGIGAADFAFSAQAKVRLQEFLGRAGILVLASHSPEFLKQFCDSGLWLSAGKIVESGSIDQIYSNYVKSIQDARSEAQN
jgi:ABC-2 type transport system ATP-binding protein/lipopolysaccharide transport system ATP-binding protein